MAFFVSATPLLGITLVVLGPAYYLLTRFYLATSKVSSELQLGASFSTLTPLASFFPFFAATVGPYIPLQDYSSLSLTPVLSVYRQHLENGSKSPVRDHTPALSFPSPSLDADLLCLFSQLYTLFSTTLSGIHTIRAFHAEDFFGEKQDEILNLSQRPLVFRFVGQLFLQISLSWMTVSRILTFSRL